MYYLTLTYDDNWLREGQYAELLRYGPDAQRWVTTDSIGGQVSAVTHYHGDFEMRSTSTGGVSMYHYLGNGLLCVTIANSQPLYYYMMTDNIGSVVHVVNGEGISEFDAWYNPWGRQTVSTNGIEFFRGYGGHEMLPQFRLVNMDGRMYDYVLGRFLSPDNYVQELENSQNFNRYSYCLNNPLKYTDPTGEFFTWSIGKGFFSFGVNFSPIGIPVGFGINAGWADGNSMGIYGEIGVRVGGTGFGSGATVSQSFDYNYKYGSWSTTTSGGAYASLGAFNAGGGLSQTFDFKGRNWQFGWNVCAGVGFGNAENGLGLNVSYGSSGWSLGLGGYYDWHAWDDNPLFDPDIWNEMDIRVKNNCYSYALDFIECDIFGGLNPGYTEDKISIPIERLNLNDVLELALRNQRIKKPTLLNKLGFGKRGYYPVYLVIDEGIDYHWYRQDNDGLWSHKRGITEVLNYDGSNRIIVNPKRANHNYGTANYNDGGILLWIRKP